MMYFWSLKYQFPCDIGRVNYLDFAEAGISTSDYANDYGQDGFLLEFSFFGDSDLYHKV